jgi:putative endonuclease
MVKTANITAHVYYVYVLRSLTSHKRYVGYSSKPPLQKLAEHNGGATRWTRNNRPLKLIHSEEFGDARTARQREKFLKSGRGRQWLNETLLG